MAAKRIDTMDLRQLLQLKHKGISNRKIADLLGIKRNTVNDYIRVFDDHALSYQQLLEYTDQDLHQLLQLKHKGISNRKIADLFGLKRNRVAMKLDKSF